jgi:hypothetical protein
MNRRIVAVLACSISIAAAAQVSAQNVRQPRAIASSDVLSQISMFSYLEGPRSDLVDLDSAVRDNTTAEGRARNRRVEIVVSGVPLEAGGARAP